MDRAIEFVGPRRVRENAFDAEINFRCSLPLADNSGEAANDFVAALREIFRAVIKNLRAIVRSGFAPGFGLVRGFDSVANVFAIAERSLAQ